MRSSFQRLRFALGVVAAVGVALLGSARAAAQGGEPQYFAIRGATVVPVSGPRLENATVIISRGVIKAVAKDADRPGSTPWRSAADEATLSDKRVETWRSAGFTTVISAPKGGMFPGQASLLDLAGERNGDMVVKTPVAVPVSLQPAGGFASFPGSLMGSIAYVRQVWLDTDWSTKAQAIYEKNPRGVARPRFDRTEQALAEALEDHVLVLIPANNARQIRRALELADRWHVSGVLYGGQMSYEVANEIAAKKLPVLLDLKWPEAEKDADPDEVPPVNTLRFRDRAPSSPAALAKAGVKFAFYSGAITAPKDMLKAAKKSIDAGLSPDAAIRAFTLTPAEIFGVADRLGSIETGKIANLVVADGDIFDEKTKIKFVFVDGRKFTIREPEKPKDPPKGDLTGKWKFSYTTPEGPEESTVDLIMASDGSLSGTLSSTRGNANIITGYLSADKFSFTINIPIEGSPSDVLFTGTFDGTSVKGSISVQGLDIEFTGTRPGVHQISAGGAQ